MQNTPPIIEPIYIDSNTELNRYCEQWHNATLLALDTEFIRTDTFYPVGALIQVSDGNGCMLIDPLSIDDFTPFTALLENPAITKVLHSCSEDLEVFDRLFGALPNPLIDTQIAAALDGWGFSLGYQRMTEALMDIHVPKGETRSNWLQRPLTDSQIHYAALDVAYLPEMCQRLMQSLDTKGRATWLQEECASLIQRFTGSDQGQSYYKKVKSAWKLDAQQLACLQSLTAWRETAARKQDKPRGRIIKDKSCFELARLKPTTKDQLKDIDELSPNAIRQYGEQILALLSDADKLPVEQWPSTLPRPLSAESGKIVKVLKQHVRECAEQLNVAQEMLAKNKDYEELLRSGAIGDYQLPESLSGWRKSVLGDDLLNLLQANTKP